jgi:hypothetical protein
VNYHEECITRTEAGNALSSAPLSTRNLIGFVLTRIRITALIYLIRYRKGFHIVYSEVGHCNARWSASNLEYAPGRRMRKALEGSNEMNSGTFNAANTDTHCHTTRIVPLAAF